MNQIAILASGSGTNAENIIKYFSSNDSIIVSCVVCNKPGAGVLKKAETLGIPTLIYNSTEMREGNAPISALRTMGVDVVILAGYMNKISDVWLQAFRGRILNIHPALLPAYGGKGMYGHYVHEAVLANHETLSGITIHLVDEEYDHGRHLLQATCPVLSNDTAERLAQRIHALEHRYYPVVIEHYISTELR